MGQEGMDHKVWIIKSPFFAMTFLNDAKHVLGDDAAESERVLGLQNKNIEFYQMHSPDTKRKLTWHHI